MRGVARSWPPYDARPRAVSMALACRSGATFRDPDRSRPRPPLPELRRLSGLGHPHPPSGAVPTPGTAPPSWVGTAAHLHDLPRGVRDDASDRRSALRRRRPWQARAASQGPVERLTDGVLVWRRRCHPSPAVRPPSQSHAPTHAPDSRAPWVHLQASQCTPMRLTGPLTCASMRIAPVNDLAGRRGAVHVPEHGCRQAGRDGVGLYGVGTGEV